MPEVTRSPVLMSTLRWTPQDARTSRARSEALRYVDDQVEPAVLAERGRAGVPVGLREAVAAHSRSR